MKRLKTYLNPVNKRRQKMNWSVACVGGHKESVGSNHTILPNTVAFTSIGDQNVSLNNLRLIRNKKWSDARQPTFDVRLCNSPCDAKMSGLVGKCAFSPPSFGFTDQQRVVLQRSVVFLFFTSWGYFTLFASARSVSRALGVAEQFLLLYSSLPSFFSEDIPPL